MSTSIVSTLVLVLKNRIQQGARTRTQKAGLFALISFLFLLAKYPNRAIGTRDRPDLDDIAWKGLPLIGNTYAMIKNRNRFLTTIVENFEKVDSDIM